MAPLQIIGTEWLFVVLVVLVLVFGEKKIPELARALGKAMGEFQKARAVIEKEIMTSTQAINEPITKTAQAVRSSLNIESQTNSPSSLPPASSPSQSLIGPDMLEKAAHDLGIATEGKTDEQVRDEIRKALAK